jgi:hypothetical protein
MVRLTFKKFAMRWWAPKRGVEEIKSAILVRRNIPKSQVKISLQVKGKGQNFGGR